MGAQANTMGPGYGPGQGPQMGFGFNPNTGDFIGGPGIAPINQPFDMSGGGVTGEYVPSSPGADYVKDYPDYVLPPGSGGTPGGKSGGFGNMLGGVAKNFFGQIGNKIGQDPVIGAPINNMLSNIANRFPGQPGFQPQPGQPLPPGVGMQGGPFTPRPDLGPGVGFGPGLPQQPGQPPAQIDIRQQNMDEAIDFERRVNDPTSALYNADPSKRFVADRDINSYAPFRMEAQHGSGGQANPDMPDGFVTPENNDPNNMMGGLGVGFGPGLPQPGMPPGGMTPQQQQQQAQQQYFNQSANARAQNTFGDGSSPRPLPPGVSMGFGMPAPSPARAVSSTNAQMPGLMGGLLNNAQRPVARPAPRPAPLPVRAPAPAPATASRNIVSKYTRQRTRTR